MIAAGAEIIADERGRVRKNPRGASGGSGKLFVCGACGKRFVFCGSGAGSAQERKKTGKEAETQSADARKLSDKSREKSS